MPCFDVQPRNGHVESTGAWTPYILVQRKAMRRPTERASKLMHSAWRAKGECDVSMKFDVKIAVSELRQRAGSRPPAAPRRQACCKELYSGATRATNRKPKRVSGLKPSDRGGSVLTTSTMCSTRDCPSTSGFPDDDDDGVRLLLRPR
jgi:hypothetical protein